MLFLRKKESESNPMTRISDIAKAMQLSEATVSNAFTGKGRMKPETREAILECARRMGYECRSRTSSAKKKHLIVISEDFDVGFTASILKGISSEAAGHGLMLPFYSLEIGSTLDIRNPNINELNHKVKKLLSELAFEVSGILYVAQYPRRLDGLLNDLSIPCVFVFCSREDGKDVIHYDDRQGAELAVNTLLSEGRKRIAMISGPIDSIGMYLRSAGYQHALMEHQLPYDPRLVRIGDWDEQSGYEQTLQLLSKGLEIDAVFAQNDHIGLGAARAIREMGLSIPRDISVIGFDDSPHCYQTDPALTSIRPPFFEIGKTAFCRLLALAETADMPADMAGSKAAGIPGDETHTSPVTLLACSLTRRGSTL